MLKYLIGLGKPQLPDTTVHKALVEKGQVSEVGGNIGMVLPELLLVDFQGTLEEWFCL